MVNVPGDELLKLLNLRVTMYLESFLNFALDLTGRAGNLVSKVSTDFFKLIEVAIAIVIRILGRNVRKAAAKSEFVGSSSIRT